MARRPDPPRVGSAFAAGASQPGDDPVGIRREVDNSIEPLIRVHPGDTVLFDCPGLPLPPNATIEDLALVDADRPHTIVGPVHVEGARPGDTLVVDILDIQLLQGYGHTVIIPGAGLLGGDFDVPYLHNFAWEKGDSYTELRPGIRIPLNPFCGFLGTSPAESGPHSTTPPLPTGGNLDLRHLVPGSRLLLPVRVPGAMFWCGDGHAAQGDGEVCLTAIETGVTATLRFSLDTTRSVSAPQFQTPGPLDIHAGSAGYYATAAVGPDLYECSQNAIRSMIEYLGAEHGLSREEAFVLCSVVVDLKINEIDRKSVV